MKNLYLYTVLISMLIPFFGSSQKTFFLRTERDSQIVYINDILWNGDAFFTIEKNDPIYQVQVKEKFFKTEYDILHDKTNYRYTTSQEIYTEPAQLAKVKIVDLKYPDSILIDINTMDYATYQKDLMHDGELTKNHIPKTQFEIFKKLKPSAVYLNNLTNDFHDETIGRYKNYVGGAINNLELYDIEVEQDLHFLQIFADVTWSFSNKNMEMFGAYDHLGRSGKFAFNSQVIGTQNFSVDNIDSIMEMSFENALNLAIHDAILSSYLFFLDENQEKLVRQN